MMKCPRILRLLVIAAVISPPSSAEDASSSAKSAVPAPSETRIAFKRGAIEADAPGRLAKMNDEAHFVVRARAGQHMRLRVEADGPTRGLVTFPDGEAAGAPGETFFDDTLPVDGDYHIVITESLMGEEWAGKITLHVRIK